ncbi:hypothetical protein CALCODRAFT_508711 [Calocera cornea HHB12733]|uniref:Uncharacterized protein n=1 Tax=Calocera cornea HHB12733 TaxID=1353952 RepID=A0A165G4Z6_9BASI|nr:hypothetical protein CALCODRAFT_508711 [Calocera cornea HHB12733]
MIFHQVSLSLGFDAFKLMTAQHPWPERRGLLPLSVRANAILGEEPNGSISTDLRALNASCAARVRVPPPTTTTSTTTTCKNANSTKKVAETMSALSLAEGMDDVVADVMTDEVIDAAWDGKRKKVDGGEHGWWKKTAPNKLVELGKKISGPSTMHDDKRAGPSKGKDIEKTESDYGTAGHRQDKNIEMYNTTTSSANDYPSTSLPPVDIDSAPSIYSQDSANGPTTVVGHGRAIAWALTGAPLAQTDHDVMKLSLLKRWYQLKGLGQEREADEVLELLELEEGRKTRMRASSTSTGPHIDEEVTRAPPPVAELPFPVATPVVPPRNPARVLANPPTRAELRLEQDTRAGQLISSPAAHTHPPCVRTDVDESAGRALPLGNTRDGFLALRNGVGDAVEGLGWLAAQFQRDPEAAEEIAGYSWPWYTWFLLVWWSAFFCLVIKHFSRWTKGVVKNNTKLFLFILGQLYFGRIDFAIIYCKAKGLKVSDVVAGIFAELATKGSKLLGEHAATTTK